MARRNTQDGELGGWESFFLLLFGVGFIWLLAKYGVVWALVICVSVVISPFALYYGLRYLASKAKPEQEVVVPQDTPQKKSKGWQQALQGEPVQGKELGSLLMQAGNNSAIKTPESSNGSFLWQAKNADVMYLLRQARDAYVQGDFNLARECYQRVAYIHEKMSEDENKSFKSEVAAFAGEDPLYIELLALVRSVVSENPGIMQSKLVKALNTDKQKEFAYYLLYYADIRGDITRVKKGRSYELNLPASQLAKASG